jgi:hypothetical protein
LFSFFFVEHLRISFSFQQYETRIKVYIQRGFGR